MGADVSLTEQFIRPSDWSLKNVVTFTQTRLLAASIICGVLLVPGLADAQQADTGSRTGPISGYTDFHVNKDQGQDASVDFHRFVLLLNHSFTEQIRFVGELELEHAVVEGLLALG